jgi:hypothetical protein
MLDLNGEHLSRLLQVIADDQLVLGVLDDDSQILRTVSGRKAHDRPSTVSRSQTPREQGACVADLPTAKCSGVGAADRSSDPSLVGGPVITGVPT